MAEIALYLLDTIYAEVASRPVTEQVRLLNRLVYAPGLDLKHA